MKSVGQKGMTLIELMITVAIIGILAGIAYPSFTQYMIQARRADAQSDMLKMQLGMEKWRANRASYRSDATAVAPGVAITNTPANAGFSGSNSYYTYTITGTTGSEYTINAAAQGSQANDTGCTPLTLDQSGGKGTAASCWKK